MVFLGGNQLHAELGLGKIVKNKQLKTLISALVFVGLIHIIDNNSAQYDKFAKQSKNKNSKSKKNKKTAATSKMMNAKPPKRQTKSQSNTAVAEPEPEQIIIDASVYNPIDDITYHFVGQEYYKKELDEVVEGPFDIEENWGSDLGTKKTPLTAAAFKNHGEYQRYYFFNKNKWWYMDHVKELPGNPIEKSYADGDWGQDIRGADAAVFNEDSGKYYFFKGDKYYRKEVGKKMSGPNDIKGKWGDLEESDFDSAFYDTVNNRYNFIKGDSLFLKNMNDDSISKHDF